MGLTDADIAAQLAIGFEGAPVSTYWEGKRDLDITLRLASTERTALDDVGAAYIAAPNGARLPLRSVAAVTPEWHSSRIVRRNGARTLTILSFSKPDVLPSTVLKAAQLQIAALKLPNGMRAEVGGELEGSAEVQGSVNLALLTSLISVFLILVFQFRTVRHPLIVMVSIPLAIVGAALGLLLTHNPFTYTANLGLNALVGMVVRNAIILVDCALELKAQGLSLDEAAVLAGRRRLRPIFLTTMAAALGVTPMILSRSPLWSPMASVIAVGLIVSMAFTLIVVPVLWLVVERRAERRAQQHATVAVRTTLMPARTGIRTAAATIVAMLLLGVGVMTFRPTVARAQVARDTLHMSLDEAVERSIKHGVIARLARVSVEAASAHERGARAAYLPTVRSTANFLQSDGHATIQVPGGVLGNDGSGTPIPATNKQFEQGGGAISYAQLSVTQPLTQVYRIRAAAGLAAAEAVAANADRDRTEAELTLVVTRLYLGILVAQAKVRAANTIVESRAAASVDATNSVSAGIDVSARALSARAEKLDAEYAVAVARNEAADLQAKLDEELGLPPGMLLVLELPESISAPLRSMSEYITHAQLVNPDIAWAQAGLSQAQHGIKIARADWIPEIGVGATYTYQHGVAFLPSRTASLAIKGSWTILDFGKRGAVMEERQTAAQRATISLAHARDETTVLVERAYRRAVLSDQRQTAAQAAVEAQRSVLAVVRDKERQGIVSSSHALAAQADVAQSELAAFISAIDQIVARAELDRAIGRRQ